MILYKKSDIPEHLQQYFQPAEIGLEETPELYIQNLVAVFHLLKEKMADDGTLWLNIGDSYASQGGGQVVQSINSDRVGGSDSQNSGKSRTAPLGLKPKDLFGIPWMLAFALRADGWYLRQDIIWSKPNPMPESVTDRCTKAHEYIFLLSKSQKYYYDNEAIKESAINAGKSVKLGSKSMSKGQAAGANIAASGNGNSDYYTVVEMANKRSVWTVTTKSFAGAHFATFPPDLIVPCIKAGSAEGDVIYDPFMGAGTTAKVALQLNRLFIGSEISAEYCEIARKRIHPLLHNLFT